MVSSILLTANLNLMIENGEERLIELTSLLLILYLSCKKLFYNTGPSTQKIIFRVGQNSGFSRVRKPIEILDFSVANGFSQMVLWLQLGEKNLRLNINNLKIDSKLSHRCKVYKKNLWGKSHFLWLDPNLCFFREDARNEVDSLNSVK